jgi:alpha-beta hydrolase superfamily lysophospholipase
LDEKDRGYFYEYSGNAIVEDAAQVTRFIKNEYPNLPVALFGHSMGSMVARCYLQKYDRQVEKAIICGSPSKNPMVGMAIFIEKCIRLFKGAHHRSKMLAYLSTGKGDENFPGEGKGAWLSRNRKNIDEYYASPKSNYKFTCNGFENLFKMMRNTYRKNLYAVKNPDMPILFVAGGDDAVIVSKEKWLDAVEFMRKVGYTNVDSKLYDGYRHEVHNDIGNEVPLADLLAFVNGAA